MKTTKPPTMRDVSNLMADALAGDAALSPEARALYNAVHDALCAAGGVARGVNPVMAQKALREAADRMVARAIEVRASP